MSSWARDYSDAQEELGRAGYEPDAPANTRDPLWLHDGLDHWWPGRPAKVDKHVNTDKGLR